MDFSTKISSSTATNKTYYDVVQTTKTTKLILDCNKENMSKY